MVKIRLVPWEWEGGGLRGRLGQQIAGGEKVGRKMNILNLKNDIFSRRILNY